MFGYYFIIYGKDTANREERQIKKRPPLRAEKRRALTGDERYLQYDYTARTFRSQEKIRPRPPGGSRFGFKPGPGSRAGGKGFVPVHERRTAGRCDLFGGQLMLTGLQADIGIQLCRDDVLRQTASSPMTYHTAIQMRQRMRVSSSFSEQKRCGERSAHS